MHPVVWDKLPRQSTFRLTSGLFVASDADCRCLRTNSVLSGTAKEVIVSIWTLVFMDYPVDGDVTSSRSHIAAATVEVTWLPCFLGALYLFAVLW